MVCFMRTRQNMQLKERETKGLAISCRIEIFIDSKRKTKHENYELQMLKSNNYENLNESEMFFKS